MDLTIGYLQEMNITSKDAHSLKSVSLAYSFYELYAFIASLHV